MPKLTDKRIESIKPVAKAKEYKDGHLPGPAFHALSVDFRLYVLAFFLLDRWCIRSFFAFKF